MQQKHFIRSAFVFRLTPLHGCHSMKTIADAEWSFVGIDKPLTEEQADVVAGFLLDEVAREG